MKRLTLSFVCLAFVIEANSTPVLRGTVELQQPDNTRFNASFEGDEFLSYGKTTESETYPNYVFLERTSGYYYAVLDSDGFYTPSDSLVGINLPPAGIGANLEISENAKSILAAKLQSQEEMLYQIWEDYENLPVINGKRTIDFAVILVDFADSVHYVDTLTFKSYKTADFDSSLFAVSNYWYDEDQINIPNPHPDGKAIFGSMRNFYDEQSRGKLEITGNVLNPDTTISSEVYPKWTYLPATKDTVNETWDDYKFRKEAIKAFINKFGTNGINNYVNVSDTTDYAPLSFDKKLIIIYAGKMIEGHTLHPKAILDFGTTWTGEQMEPSFADKPFFSPTLVQ